VATATLAMAPTHGWAQEKYGKWTFNADQRRHECSYTFETKDGKSLDVHQYWSVGDAAAQGRENPFSGEDHEALEAIDGLLRDSVQRRMVTDVPLGAFLSGGIDSSATVALMQAQSSDPVKTFTIGFEDRAYDESRDAAAVAKHLGTEHTELIVSPEEAQAVIPRLPEIYDEPFADSSQIPTFLVSQLARRHVTVSLSGDGGDEVFGGYNRYSYGPRVWNRVRRVPRLLREPVGAAIASVSPRTWDRILGPTGQRMADKGPGRKRSCHPYPGFHRICP
jgi:asparagine synthase (glutamine-hydrolysing)